MLNKKLQPSFQSKTAKKAVSKNFDKARTAKKLPRVAPSRPYYSPTAKTLKKNAGKSNGVGVGY